MIEPFAGSASFFFHVRPDSALLADSNHDLIETFRAVRQEPVKVAHFLSRFPKTKGEYYRLRAPAPAGRSAAFLAARFIYLNRYCYGGIYRTNSSGNFNVPYAGARTGTLPTVHVLLEASTHLAKADLLTADFESVIRNECQAGDFVFLDPPYLSAQKRVFKQYGPVLFSAFDLDRLADCLAHIDRRGASFVLTYSAGNEAKRAFAGWRTKSLASLRRLGPANGGSSSDREVIVSNLSI